MKINSTITSAPSHATKRQTVKNETAEARQKSTIQSKNDYESATDRMIKILDKKYSKIYEQNKRYDDPFGHITDKYRDPYSPKFRSDLTKAERDAAFNIELSWLRDGEGGYYSSNDAIFRDERYVSPSEDSINKKVFNRGKVNEQLHALFSKSGLKFPDNLGFRITIDPNNFQLTVEGPEDEGLVSELEKLLNEDSNARELFFHIMKSRTDDSGQFTAKSLEKFRLVNQIKTMTGYDLKDLEIVDGKFITENGDDLLDIYRAELRKNPYTAKHAHIAAAHYGSKLHELAKNGFDSIPDLVLSIDYKNNALHDIGQSINFGSWGIK